MDIPWDLIERIESEWSENISKPIQTGKTNEGRPAVWLYAEVGGLRLHLAVSVGSRKSVRETVLVLDTNRRILADRILICRFTQGMTDGELLPIRAMGEKIRAGGDKIAVCFDEINAIHNDINEHPDRWEEKLKLLVHANSIGDSVDPISGGYGFGKRMH